MRLAVIPARGGSKRIPGKNIKDFFGRPMIAYSIQAARESGLFDAIVVSTDSTEVAEIARREGADVPFLRPEQLADDFTPTAPVVLHALQQMERNGRAYESLCCIYPTAPMIEAADLHLGERSMADSGAAGAFSVGRFSPNPQRSLLLRSDHTLEPVFPGNELKRSNDLEDWFFDAGKFYWLKAESFRKEPRMWAAGGKAVELPWWKTQDIDTPEDWEMAEVIFLRYRKHGRDGR